MKKKSFITMMLLIVMLSISSTILAQPGTPDRDGDGVADSVDRCISDFGPASNNGCPEETTGSTTTDNTSDTSTTTDNNPDTSTTTDNNPDTSTTTDNTDTQVPTTDNTDTQVPADIPPDSDGDGTADPLDLCPSIQGDGANGGCPEGYDPNADPIETQEVAPTLLSAPISDNCLASPSGLFGVNIRTGAHPDAEIIHVLQLNEWATVLSASYQADYPPFSAEHEPASLSLPFGVEAPSLDLDPDPIDDLAVNKPIWLLIETNDGFIGWVNQSVIRYGGDCSELILPDDDIEVLEMIFMPVDGNSVGFPNENPFISFPIIPDPMPTFEFDILLPTNPNVPSAGTSILAPGCELINLEAGVFILICPPESPTPIVDTMGTLIPAGCELINPEAGVFILVCPPIEPTVPVPAIPLPENTVLPESCELISPEAGVFILVCDEDVDPAPLIDTMGTILPEGCELTHPEVGVFYLDCTPDEEAIFTPANTGFDFAPECMYVEQEVGVFVLECADDSTPIIMYCVTELGSEAGMYVEVCYEIEIPEGCTVDTSEAGVWSFDCDEDGEVNVTPFGNDAPILNVRNSNDAVLVGLLLPAVQQVREAARR